MTDETKTVLIEIRSVYGNELIYPANKTAELFAKITGNKTISRAVIEHIKELGFEVKVKMQTL